MGLFYLEFFRMPSTTEGSNNVEVSPKVEVSPSATFLKFFA